MADLIVYGKSVTLEQYVKYWVNKNDGVRTYIQRSDMIHYLKEAQLTPAKRKETREELLIRLHEAWGNDWTVTAKKLCIGVKGRDYIARFPFVTSGDLKRLEKFGAIHIVGYEAFRMYGKECYAALYDVIEFCEMTKEQLQSLLITYPKGKRRY